jgi:hypothetical protein
MELSRQIAIKYKLSPKLKDTLAVLYVNEVVLIEDVDRVIVHRLRKELKPHGIVINTKRTVGYWLSDDMKAAIASRLAS